MYSLWFPPCLPIRGLDCLCLLSTCGSTELMDASRLYHPASGIIPEFEIQTTNDVVTLCDICVGCAHDEFNHETDWLGIYVRWACSQRLHCIEQLSMWVGKCLALCTVVCEQRIGYWHRYYVQWCFWITVFVAFSARRSQAFGIWWRFSGALECNQWCLWGGTLATSYGSNFALVGSVVFVVNADDLCHCICKVT